MSDVSELVDAGMRRQIEDFRAALRGGMPRLGWKVGLNDPAAQQRLGLPGPVVVWLNGRRLIRDGVPYDPPAGARPRIEAETAILLGSDVDGAATPDEALAAIAAVAPAIEFVDATKPLSPLDALLGNDILHEAVLIGPSQRPEQANGLVDAGFPKVSKNGEDAGSGLAGRYPDNLGVIVAAVASTISGFGEALRAGDWIIGGSYIDPFDVASGDAVEANFGPLGVISFSVA